MRGFMKTSNARGQIAKVMRAQHPVKLLGAFALGALLVTVIGLPMSLIDAGNPVDPVPREKGEVAPSMADPYDRSLHDDVPEVEPTFNVIGLKAGEAPGCRVILGEEWFHPISGELTAPLPDWIQFDNRTNTYVRQGC